MFSVTLCSVISGAVVVTDVVSVVVSGGAAVVTFVVVFSVVTFVVAFAVVSAFELSFVLGISFTPKYSVLP